MRNIFLTLFKKKGLLQLFAVCYSIIAVTLLLGFFVNMRVINKYFKNNVSEINEYNMINMAQNLDSYIGKITRSASVIGGSDEFKGFLQEVSKNGINHSLNSKLIEYMKNVNSINSGGYDNDLNTSVYFSESDLIVGTYGEFSSEDYFARLFGRNDEECSEFFNSVISRNGWGIYEYGGNSRIFYCLHIKKNTIYKKEAVLITEIDAANCRNFIKTAYNSDDTTVFLRINGTDMILSDVPQNSEIIENYFNNKLRNHTLLVHNSGVSDIEYCQILNENYLDKVYFKSAIIMIINILLVFIIISMTLIVYMKNQYNPILDVLKSYEKSLKRNSSNANLSEIQLLKMYSDVIIENANNIDEKLALINLMYDDDNDGHRNLDNIKLLGLSDCKILRVISIAPHKESIQMLYNNDFSTRDIKTIVTNIFEEIIGKFAKYKDVYENNQLIFVIYDYNFDENLLIEEINEALDVIKNHFSMKISIGIGEEVESVINIHRSYVTSKEALVFMRFYELEGKMFFDDLETNLSNVNIIGDICKELEISLKNNNEDKIQKNIENILEYYLKNNISVSRLKYDILSIISTLERMLVSDKENLVKQYENNYKLFNTFDSFGKFKQELSNHFSHMMSLIDSKSESVSFKGQAICKYLDSNFSCSDLTNVKVADYFGINPSYLSRMFKKTMGINITDYITELRVENAKELLSTSIKTIEEISLDCGFTTVHTFTRVFKKYTGKTPGQFRNSSLI